MNVKYFHLVPFGLEKTVLDAQLITPALKLKDAGFPVTLIVMDDLPTWVNYFKSKNRADAAERLKGLPAIFLPRFPRNFLWMNNVLLLPVFLPALVQKFRIVIHARGLQGSDLILPLKRIFKSIRLICDVRGLEADEYVYSIMKKQGSLNWVQKMWAQCLARISQRVLRGSDINFCVSESMKNHLVNWAGNISGAGWERIPCAVDVGVFSSELAHRQSRREEMGLKGRFVVVYSGAFRDWQLPETSVQIFKIFKSINPKTFFLCLTPDVEAFVELLQKNGINSDDYLVKHVPFKEMQKYLVVGDVGLLLREENPLNTYSCPTKFPEYLACGLHVVATPAIKEVADLIRGELVGTLLENLGDPHLTEQALNHAFRISELEMTRIERSLSIAQRYYDWSRYIPQIKKWYLQLSQ